MLKKLNTDQRIALFFLAFGIVYLLLAQGIPKYSMAVAVDADVFPKAIGVLTLILSVALFIVAGKSVKPEKKESPWASLQLKQGISLIILSIFYIALLEPLGFIITTFIFLTLTPFVLGWKRWGISVSVALGFSIGMYYIFAELMVQLPQGIWPF